MLDPDKRFIHNGAPCRRHPSMRGYTVRYATNGACVVCVRERAAAQRKRAADNVPLPQPTAVDDCEDLI